MEGREMMEKSEPNLDVMIQAFNKTHQMDARVLTADTLKAYPKGQIGKDGWFCYYSLFCEDGRCVLASYCGHRMTNDQYEELDDEGTVRYSWSSWGGMVPMTGYSRDYIQAWEETKRRASRAGITASISD